MDESRAKVSMLSLILAFAVQAIAVAWFLSDLHSTIGRVEEEQIRRSVPVWGTKERLSNVETRVDWMIDHLKDVESRLRKMEGAR